MKETEKNFTKLVNNIVTESTLKIKDSIIQVFKGENFKLQMKTLKLNYLNYKKFKKAGPATYPMGFYYCVCGIDTQTLSAKKIKSKKLLEIKMTGKCLKGLFQQCTSINFKNVWPISPHHKSHPTSHDTKTSSFRYKLYPPKISGYVSENQYNLRNNPEMHEIPVKVEHDQLEEKIIENYLNLNLKIAIN